MGEAWTGKEAPPRDHDGAGHFGSLEKDGAIKMSDKETLAQKVKRLERETRMSRERDQNREEREQGPADAEGVGGHPSVLVLRDKNFDELKRMVDRLPSIPGLRPKSDPNGKPLGFRLAVYYVQTEVAKMVDSVIVCPPTVTARWFGTATV